MRIFLLILLFVKMAIMIAVILFAGIDLNPEEAQYWTWSRNLAWGYYSKPPGIAWEIWLGCKLFGNTELGIRIGAVVFAFLTALAVYFLALGCKLKEETAFWAGAIMAISPLGIMGSFLTVTDGGMIFFWTVACYLMASSDCKPNPLLLGFVILCGALFKWPIYLFWIFAVIFYPTLKMIPGILISLLGLLPSIYWNSSHDWVTFRHVFATIAGQHQGDLGATYLRHGNLGDFFAAQWGLLSPLFFFFLLLGFVSLLWNSHKLTKSLLFCAVVSLSLLSVYTTLSYFQKMQGNWCVFAYPTGIVFLSWYLLEAVSWGRVWIYLGTIGAILQSLFLYSVPALQRNDLFSIPYPFNIFRHSMGWNQLKTLIYNVGYDPKTEFLFGDKYQMSSILSFYGPGQNRAYFLNLQRSRKNQFSFWPSMKEEQLGKTGYFVLAENNPYLKAWNAVLILDYQSVLEQYFEKVEFFGIFPLFLANEEVVKSALIFKCFIYNGKERRAYRHL